MYRWYARCKGRFILSHKGVIKTRQGMILHIYIQGCKWTAICIQTLWYIILESPYACYRSFQSMPGQKQKGPDNEWQAQVQTLLRCQAIYGKSSAMSTGKLDNWRNQQKISRQPMVTNSADSVATTPGRYFLRSSVGSQMHWCSYHVLCFCGVLNR